MGRYRYGDGDYAYFATPLPPCVQRLREELYPPLAEVADAWARRSGQATRWPPDLAGLLERCRDHGQTRPTPLVLRYGPGGYNTLHQDRYGDVAFPLQVVVGLSEPGVDYTGGEFVLTEQRPRAQTRATAIALERGSGVVFPNDRRPVERHGAAGATRVSHVSHRHGASEVRSGAALRPRHHLPRRPLGRDDGCADGDPRCDLDAGGHEEGHELVGPLGARRVTTVEDAQRGPGDGRRQLELAAVGHQVVVVGGDDRRRDGRRADPGARVEAQDPPAGLDDLGPVMAGDLVVAPPCTAAEVAPSAAHAEGDGAEGLDGDGTGEEPAAAGQAEEHAVTEAEVERRARRAQHEALTELGRRRASSWAMAPPIE